MRYITVSFPRSPLKPFTYSVPEGFPPISEGMRVLVPLANRFATGFVIETKVSPSEESHIKPIADLLDPENLFSPSMLKLTKWMSDYYLAEWADLLKSALPPGLDVRPETLVKITASGGKDSSVHAILKVLHEKEILPLKEIYSMFGHRGTYSQLKMLESQGYVHIIAEKRVKRHGYNMVEVVQSSTFPSGKKDLELYEFLSEAKTPVWVEDLRNRFKNASTFIRRMAERGQVRCFWMPASPKNLWPEMQPVDRLNPAQQNAFSKILERSSSFRVFLLHGVTGSGKTEVYLRLAQEVLSRGKSVLILVPEIALLPLIVHRAEQTLKNPLSILHSELTERERLEEWQKARRGEVRLVIGARSAVFAPLNDLGLILMDEEHDGSYKQAEYPRYHARESGIMRAQFEGCPIVLGSATPSIETFFNAGNGKYEYLSLPHRVEDRAMPLLHLVDMKEEYRQTGNPIFSRMMLAEITKKLDRKEQILVLLNRRGYASLLMCRLCGKVLECPHCSVTLTFHKITRRMVCHYCGYSRLAPSNCSVCESALLHFFGVGTQKIAEALKKSFPSARIERFDRDATQKRGSIGRILTRFAGREIDILVGTQMLAKGHDFPGVTLVGVVGADYAIGIPDFRSSERLYQLITQVAGRSGRGDEPGLVILQTFHPDHYALRCSIEQSYEGFYEKEIRFRRLMQYPPYVSMANVIISGKEAKATLEEARELAKLILVFKTEAVKILGPAVATIARISGLYRFQILVKSSSRKELHECLHPVEAHFNKEGKRKSRISIDIDPYSIV